jgi:hypothetical protein
MSAFLCGKDIADYVHRHIQELKAFQDILSSDLAFLMTKSPVLSDEEKKMCHVDQSLSVDKLKEIYEIVKTTVVLQPKAPPMQFQGDVSFNHWKTSLKGAPVPKKAPPRLPPQSMEKVCSPSMPSASGASSSYEYSHMFQRSLPIMPMTYENSKPPMKKRPDENEFGLPNKELENHLLELLDSNMHIVPAFEIRRDDYRVSWLPNLPPIVTLTSACKVNGPLELLAVLKGITKILSSQYSEFYFGCSRQYNGERCNGIAIYPEAKRTWHCICRACRHF